MKNGKIHNGKQNHKYRSCGRQFVLQPQKKLVSPETRALIDPLLLERISLAGIARAAQVSETWLQAYVSEKYAQVPRTLTVTPKKGRLTLDCDELWSFVGNKNQKYWIWLALDQDTREIVGVYIGERSQDAAQAPWASIPISRLVRKSLAFSKEVDNHIGALWNFIHHYNAFLQIEWLRPYL